MTSRAYVSRFDETPGVSELLDKWRDTYGDYHKEFPADVARRLEQMPDEIRAEFTDPDLVNRVFYERFHVLLVLTLERPRNRAAFDMGVPPSEAEKVVGTMIG